MKDLGFFIKQPVGRDFGLNTVNVIIKKGLSPKTKGVILSTPYHIKINVRSDPALLSRFVLSK